MTNGFAKTAGIGIDFRFSRLTEELDEVAAALQGLEGLRLRKVETNLAGEVGDLIFTLAAFANTANIDLEKRINE